MRPHRFRAPRAAALAFAIAAIAALPIVGCSNAPPPPRSDGAVVDLTAPAADLAKEQGCGGLHGDPCPAGMFCETSMGQCCCDVPGICRSIPSACGTEQNEVCGCDDATYQNDCLRQKAGVSASAPGRCP